MLAFHGVNCNRTPSKYIYFTCVYIYHIQRLCKCHHVVNEHIWARLLWRLSSQHNPSLFSLRAAEIYDRRDASRYPTASPCKVKLYVCPFKAMASNGPVSISERYETIKEELKGDVNVWWLMLNIPLVKGTVVCSLADIARGEMLAYEDTREMAVEFMLFWPG